MLFRPRLRHTEQSVTTQRGTAGMVASRRALLSALRSLAAAGYAVAARLVRSALICQRRAAAALS